MSLNLLIFYSVFFVFIILSVILFLLITNKKYSIFNIIIIYLGLSLVDTFVPTILWSIYGNENLAPWLKPFSPTELAWGILFYSLFYIIMFSIMLIFAQTRNSHFVNSFKKADHHIKNKIDTFLIITGSIFLISLIYEINQYGGVGEWLFNKFTLRFDPTPRGRSLLEIFLITVPWRTLFNALVFLAFLYRHKFKRPKLYGLVLPLIGIIFAFTTSFRGSILIFLLGLFFMENIRIFIHKEEKYKSLFGIGKETLNKPKYYIFAFFIVSAFLSYGALRAAYVDTALGRDQDESSVVYDVLNQGAGIQGISGVMRRYGEDLDFMMGKTYFDMLLLPIPRVIYTSKPEWYGIDDITTGMGWPPSTQNAVTMSGEAYANFGWIGLLVAVIYGLGFGLFLRFINRKGGIYTVLYASVLIQVIFVSNWMAFTGIMNQFFAALFLFCMLFLINNKFKLS